MSLVGKYVTIKDNYEGNLEDVIGKTAKVVSSSGEFLALDLKAYKKNQDHRYWDYDAVVKESEVEVKEFEFTDSKGQKVEIGDKVVYGPLGGGVTVGEVVDIKEATHSRWGGSYTETKVQLRIESEKAWTDGDRWIRLPDTTTRWYSHGGRMLVIQKGSMNYLSSFGKITISADSDRLW
jgi:hypothetical protein